MRRRLRAGRPVATLQKRPRLIYDAAPYWAAFCFLSKRRPAGMGLSAIPGAELNAYLARRGITDIDECADYERFVDAMDTEYLHWHAKRREQQVNLGKGR